MILICYDGSEDAKAAIARAAELMPAESATVLTVWQPIALMMARLPTGLGPIGWSEMEDSDAAAQADAERRATEGAALAGEAGLSAAARTCSQDTTAAHAILDEAEAVGASAIVMGSRGLTGLKSLLLGSVSHAVINHADRTVIVVPSPEVADSRTQSRHALHADH